MTLISVEQGDLLLLTMLHPYSVNFNLQVLVLLGDVHFWLVQKFFLAKLILIGNANGKLKIC